VTTPVIADCAGLWRRTLLIGADGSHDTGTDVLWLQGISAYVDSRGFAGTLRQNGDIFEWRRDIDLQPPSPLPDAGSMRWDGGALVETGVHEDYVEHWVRDTMPSEPSGALLLTAPDGGNGLLVRVGDLFGWAGAGVVVIDVVTGRQWKALGIELSAEHVEANGVRWRIEQSEGNMNP
jgi:hypothetical protein